MSNGMMTSLTGISDERQEGELLQNDALSLGMSDGDIARAIGNRVEASEAFWNKEIDLDKVRDENEKFWLGTYFDSSKLHDFQVPYKDNRIFTSIETLIPLAVAKAPQPTVTEAYDTEASRELARNIEKWLMGKYEDLYLLGKFHMVARHLLIGYRNAVMKYRWDTSIGQLQEDGTRFGDIAVEVKRPQRVVIDAGAQDQDNIPLIGEYLTATTDELCYQYPEKKDEIYRRMGGQAGVAVTNTRLGYLEVWFDYHDKKGKQQSAVAWKLQDLVLGAMKNPNFNYDEMEQDQTGRTQPLNFFDKPKKPYIIYSFLNIGRWVMDDTSLTEQAAELQKVLDKRGRQIVENADQANAGMVLNSDMIKSTEVAKLLGDPGEKLMVKGDVRMAATRLPINILPPYVMDDKVDARNEIDNIFSTHGAVRGEVTKSKTLGQDVLSQRGDASRIATLATAMEDGADRLYKGMVQMAKVMYDLPQLQRFDSPEGSTSFTEFSNQQIEPNIKIRVKSGSVLPEDKMAKKDETVQLMPILDPLTIAEGMGWENPKEKAKRLLYYRVMPDRYIAEVLKIDGMGSGAPDPSATQEIQLLNSGQNVPPQQNPTKEHIATHQAFIEAPEFQALPPEAQQLHLAHIKAEVQSLKDQMGMSEQRPGLPPQQGETGIPPQTEGDQPTATPTATPQGTGTPTEQPQPGGVMSKIAGLFR